ncbi:DUF2812 domain-containing protein [Bacillus mangrovi]|uniref:DUF2812 domain-containing protein n=1 Tax=Metabacillus mangrovi TaxID=1491830 RepID=A0A7X2S6H0_9BACI|nr:DUF2812 domain-containing protein [Metabacillus mangrovi]MTH54544.1 DUF2812 domain-containing protein [Metabacillus mangrovi]
MRRTKYIMSGGLAFSEDKDMEKLRRFSLKGWHVSGFKFMGYVLEKGEKLDCIYSVDYRPIKEEEEEEYAEFFSSSGWAHIASEGDVHLFRANPGTKPIYTDRETTVEKYENSARPINKLAVPLVLATVLLWVGAMVSYGFLNIFLTVAAIVLSVIAIPAAWTALAAARNRWKANNKKTFVYVSYLLPILVLLIAVLGLLLFDIRAVRMLVYMVIGAIAFPATIWFIMSFSHKMRKDKV